MYQRDGNSKKKRIKNQRSKTPLQKWRMLFISSRVDWTAEKTITVFQTKRKRVRKHKTKNRLDYLRTVGQL